MNKNPIGILDSGIGGLSIWKEFIKQFPNESTIYFADTKNCPYGPRKLSEIANLAEKVVEYLIKQDVKLILVACNTITVSVINKLRNKFDVPFVGVEPATKVASEYTKTGNIGILATKGTFDGDLYKETKDKFANGKNIFIQIGEGLVEIVENQTIQQPDSIRLIRNYVDYFLKENVDQVALGCTHYPFLKNTLEELSDNKINFIDPAKAVVKQAGKILESNNLFSDSSTATHRLISSGQFIDLTNLIPKINEMDIHFEENFNL